MTQIGFKLSEHRKWQFTLCGKLGTISETVTPNGFYLYDWRYDVGGSTTQIGVAQSDHHLSKEEVEAKALARQTKFSS